MADTILQLNGDLSGFSSPVVKVFSGTGTAVALNGSGDALSLISNRQGLYQATISESLAGVHYFEVVDGSVFVGSGWCYLEDTTGTFDGYDTQAEAILRSQHSTSGFYSHLKALNGTALSQKAGSNFELFFNNGGADTAKTVNDVGSSDGGVSNEDILDAVEALLDICDGCTSLPDWLALIMGKTPDATTLAEVNARLAGTTYNNEQHSLEATGDRVVSNTITLTGGANTNVEGTLIIISEDDYHNADGFAFTFESADWPDLTGSTVTFRCKKQGRTTGTSQFFNTPGVSGDSDYAEVQMTVIDEGTALQKVRLQLVNPDSNLAAGTYFMHIRAVLASGRKRTLLRAERGMIVQSIVEDE